MSVVPQRLRLAQNVPSSALLSKLATFIPLNDSEAIALQNCERDVHRFGRRKVLRRQGEATSDLLVLRSGWAFSFAIMPDGSRQILDLHFPGDLIGLPSLAFDCSHNGLATITPIEMSALARAEYVNLLSVSPRLRVALHAMAMVENVILTDRLKSIGRMEARDRVAYFFLQILTRLESTEIDRRPMSSPSRGLSVVGEHRRSPGRDSFHLPMSQELIGDALGLSAIHVNRVLRRLENEGHLFRDHQQFTLLNRQKLSESVNFSDRYSELTTTWMPD